MNTKYTLVIIAKSLMTGLTSSARASAVALAVACLFSEPAQAQVTCNWAVATGGNFSDTANWSEAPYTIPVDGGNNNYVLRNVNATGGSMTNDFPTSPFVLNAITVTRSFSINGSYLEFQANNSGAIPFINFANKGDQLTINANINLTTSLISSGTSVEGGPGFRLTGVISGSGNITNTRASTTDNYYSMYVDNPANTFTGNWVAAGGRICFTNDGAIGSISNNIILTAGGMLAFLPPGVTLSPGHAIQVLSGGGRLYAKGNMTLTLANTNTLQGYGTLTLGDYGSGTILSVAAEQPNFTGSITLTGATSARYVALNLNASNALANASGIDVGTFGTLNLNSSNGVSSNVKVTSPSGNINLNHPYGAGSSTITNMPYCQVTLGTNLVVGGTRVYLSDMSAISGTDARLGYLTSPGNITIPAGAYPMVIHAAGGVGTISGIDNSSLVYGLGGNTNADLTIGDTVASQWRGYGARGVARVMGTSANTLTLSGNAVLDAVDNANASTLTINSKITGGNAANTLGIRGNGTVVLMNINNDFASSIQGVGSPILKAGHTANTMTFKFAPGSNTFNQIYNTSTGTLVLDGAGSTNVVTLVVGTTGGIMVFSNGFYSLAGLNSGAGQSGGLTLAGANLVYMQSAGRLNFGAADSGPVNITSGSLVVTNTQYGFKVGALSGSQGGGNFNATVNQSGGSVIVYPCSNGRSLDIGGTDTYKTNAYYLSGGLMNLAVNAILLGADLGGTTLAQFSLTGGKLIAQGTISGSQGAGARQVFDFSGGTLAPFTVDATKLASTNAPTVQGTLVNNGGTLAPGDIGTAGKTIVTGNYTETSPNAVLALDIGGTTQGSAFQTGTYDYLSVSASATLTGRLSVSLFNGYMPATTATKFTVLTSAALSGSFANVSGGKVWCADGYSRFDVLFNTTAKTVILSNYVANAWSQATGGTWTNAANWALATEPGSSDYAAYFGTGLASSDTVTLDTARTVRGLTFTNSAASYTISGAALTLQGDALTTPKISVLSGSHTISVSMALSNATEIAVATNSTLTITENITGAQNVTKTGTGLLVLSGATNTLGALAISAGAVRFADGATTVSAFTLASGTTCDFVTGSLSILKNGGGLDTVSEVTEALTTNAFTVRGKTAVPADFKVTDEGSTIKVMAKVKGTLIRFM